jgi:hypothetical protein
MDGIWDHHVKQNKPDRQILHVCLSLQNWDLKKVTNIKGELFGVGKPAGGGKRAKRKGDGGLNMIKVHYMHVWKQNNETH